MVTHDCSSASHFDSLERSIKVLLNQGDSWVSLTSPKSPLCFDGGETSGNSKASERRYGACVRGLGAGAGGYGDWGDVAAEALAPCGVWRLQRAAAQTREG
ncbi:hypothetical protein ERO13_A02G006101v2 [Gossypium hirsutum]|uniref:Uncharacterized protein n=1 Tax=Gossypium darwinii TaxID=34276 RepID=A0A5D2H9Q9_GOSDA|nr:hypothetical protein ERO13_A02G006101v2 [Gossypium hirsutum]TYH26660.1 hypothetical protein ES288_A02G006500v1 [Gossypium darwinii]